MPTYVIRGGEMVEKQYAPLPGRSHLPAPGIISDNMDPIRHMSTGRYHTSKAAFRADTKASGCVEIGNDTSILKPRTPIKLDPRKRREDIKRSIHQLRHKGRR